jgi:hypothetical protein
MKSGENIRATYIGFPSEPNLMVRLKCSTLLANVRLRLRYTVRVWNGDSYQYVPSTDTVNFGNGNGGQGGGIFYMGIQLSGGELISVHALPEDSVGGSGILWNPAATFITGEIGIGRKLPGGITNPSGLIGNVVNFTSFARIFSGYVSNTGLSWTMGQGTFFDMLPPHGIPFIDNVTIPDPANQFSWQPPRGSVCRVHCVTFDFTTDATAIDRQAKIILNPSIFTGAANIAQGATLTWRYQFGIHLPIVDIPGLIQPLYQRPLLPTIFEDSGLGGIDSDVENMQAGDTWGGIYVSGERWISPDNTTEI